MKRYSMLILLFVLTAALMTGCGCTGPTVDQTEAPTVLPTNEEVKPTTKPTTQPTTLPATEPSVQPDMATEPFDNGNGPVDPTTGSMATEPTDVSRAKKR